ncbi:MAG: pilus assembly protein PilM [Phycisphaerales bacterium]|nr:pilus assembly protein PilM [Phycisphaerales bacterium]
MNFLTHRLRATTGHVGIAFGETDIRLVQVRDHRGQIDVTGAASLANPLGSDTGGLSDAIRAAFITGGFIGRKCVVSIPRSEIWMQVARLPEMPDTELGEAVAWEAADRFGVARESLECDWIRTGVAQDRQEVLIVAADTLSMTRRLDPVLAAGLRPVAVDTGFAGVARLFSRRFRRDADSGKSRAILDVGASGSMLMVLRGREISFCKPVSIGGRHIDARIAERLDLEQDAAAELRQVRLVDESGLDPATNGAVTDAARPVMAELAREVMLCLRHHNVAVRGARPEHVLLSGENASEPGLADLIEAGCRLPVLLDDDAGCMADLSAGLSRALPGSAGAVGGWATAAGLSMRGIEPRRASGRRAA